MLYNNISEDEDEISKLRLSPVPGGKIVYPSNDFKNPRNFDKKLDFGHAGVDIVHPKWTKKSDSYRIVYAPESGIIVESKKDVLDSYGPWVIILKGDSGVYHLLAHLSRDPKEIFVKVNQEVLVNQALAKYDISQQTFKHVHWEVRPDIHWHGKKIPGTSTPLSRYNKWRWTYDPIKWISGDLVQGQMATSRKESDYPVITGFLDNLKNVDTAEIKREFIKKTALELVGISSLIVLSWLLLTKRK